MPRGEVCSQEVKDITEKAQRIREDLAAERTSGTSSQECPKKLKPEATLVRKWTEIGGGGCLVVRRNGSNKGVEWRPSVRNCEEWRIEIPLLLSSENSWFPPLRKR